MPYGKAKQSSLILGGRNENTLCCSALFCRKKQTWGLNFFREIKRSRQNTLGTLLIQNLELSQQTGILKE
jgi:hypothetical protein